MDLLLERTRLALLRFHWVLNLLMIALIARMLAGIIVTIIDSKLPMPAIEMVTSSPSSSSLSKIGTSATGARATYDIVVERNIFNSAPKPTSTSEVPAVATSDLLNKVRLTGTIISRKRALATFFIVPRNESDVFRIGDVVYEGWVVDNVERALVRLRSGNELQEIQLYDPEASASPLPSRAVAPTEPVGEPVVGGPSEGFVKEEGDGKYIVDKAELEAQLQNLDQLITQARVIPNYSQGKVDGFKIFAIKPNSIFQRLGMRNGDIIESINGAPLDKAEKGIQLFQELRNLPKFEINLRRQKTPRQHTYEVR